jgi:2-(acetamidomethylene)succinate hydrolase
MDLCGHEIDHSATVSSPHFERQEPSVSLHEHLVDTGRITLNVREAGDGPLVVFMHGITANGAVWDPVLTTLGKSFRVVSLDQRGHGRSDKPASGYTGADFADDLLAVVETLGGGAPALAVGHSLGARNGIVAAAARPDLISGVVAVDFTPFIEPEVIDTLAARVRGGDRTFGSRQSIVDYLSERYPRMPGDAVLRRAMHGYVESDGVYRPLADPNAMAQTADGLREDLEPATRDVKRPVLMIRGADSTLVSETAFERTRALRPDLEYLVVPGTDHYVPEEAPDVISDAVVRFAQGLR